MAFTNLAVNPDILPRAQDLELTPMAPAYRREVVVQMMIVFTPIFLSSWIVIMIPVQLPWLKTLLGLVPAMVLLLGGLLTLLALKQISVRGYGLREHDIAYRSGLVWRKLTLLPYNRVQHVEVTSGPLQRRFGLASLKFFTAGGASVDLKMEGLEAADAERLREFILGRSDAAQRD